MGAHVFSYEKRRVPRKARPRWCAMVLARPIRDGCWKFRGLGFSGLGV